MYNLFGFDKHLTFRYPQRGFRYRYRKIVYLYAVKLSDAYLYRAMLAFKIKGDIAALKFF